MAWQKVPELSLRNHKRCAFCEHWYDPSNSHINYIGFRIWEYDTEAKCRCRETPGGIKKANQFCPKYKCKI